MASAYGLEIREEVMKGRLWGWAPRKELTGVSKGLGVGVALCRKGKHIWGWFGSTLPWGGLSHHTASLAFLHLSLDWRHLVRA